MNKIIVNGVNHDINGTKLYYKDVCDYAGIDPSRSPVVIYRYKGDNSSDFLEEDDDGVYLSPESVVVFNVAMTNHT